MLRSVTAKLDWRRAALIGAASLLFAAPAMAQDASFDQLASQARHWEDRGRYDLARESWLKLLRTSPDNPAALSGLALAEAKGGRAAAAQVYLDRLREAHPGHPGIRQIEDAIRSGAYDPARLEKPRQLARDGEYDQAVAAYREAFGGTIPEGRLGLEYWQTLAGTKDGWTPARDGIARLAKTYPDEPIYQLALAQHLTYREETRRDGIARLSTLAGGDRATAAAAQQAWRQALIWLGPKPGDERLYNAYTAKYGEDAQVTARRDSLRAGRSTGAIAGAPGAVSQAPREPTMEEIRGKQVSAAYDLLNDNQLSEAGNAFEQLVSAYPDNSDAIGGLGIVRLRQERYGEARSLLQQATSRDPKRAARWKEALGTARFWEQVRAGQAAREAGQLSQAESLLRSALASDPAIAAKEPSVKSTLADLLAENGDLEEAERLYRDVLARQPGDGNALRGLIGLLVKRNRLPEALAMAENLPPDQKDELGNLGSLKGQYLRDQAKIAADNKDNARAEQLLKQALLEDPESPWTRLDLSRIYQQQKRTREANTLIDGLLTGGKQMPEAIYIKALLLAEQDNWYDGLQILEQVPYESRTQAMSDLQRRLWVRYQTDRAGVYARYGRQTDAIAILQQVEPYASETPELLGAMASAWADVGEDGRALNYMRQALSRQSQPDPGLRLQYASLLFKLRQDAEFEVVMEELVRYPGFTQQQGVDLANLRIAYRLRQADFVREDGNLARAYEYLEPLLKVNPNDPRLIMALARIYNDAKEYDRALELYQRTLQTDPNNLDAYKGAIGAALALNQPEQAEGLLEKALRLDPQNPRLYALAGRAARARGEDGRALQLFQQALRLDQDLGAGKGGTSEFGDGRYTPQLFLIDPASSPVNAPFLGYAPPEPVLPVLQLPHIELADATGTVAKKKSPDKSADSSPAGGLSRRPAPAATVAAAPAAAPRAVRVRHSAGREDRALVAVPRWWKQGRLIKVSTPPEGGQATTRYPPPASSGSGPGWVQNGPDRYTYTTSTQSSGTVSVPYGPAGSAPPLPAQSPQPAVPAYQVAPRRLEPSHQLTLPPPRSRYPSLREEVLRDIGEITGSGQPAAPQPQRAPQQAPQPPMYRAPVAPYVPPQQPSFSSQQRYSTTTTTRSYSVPAEPVPPGGVYSTNLPLGATVREYESQGLRVLPGQGDAVPSSSYRTQVQTQSQMQSQGRGSVPVQSAPAAPVYRPALREPPALQLRSDPVLTPDFVLERRRPKNDQPNEVLREISDINAKRTPYVSFGLSVRSRDGQPGLDRLSDLETPLEASVAGASAGRFKLRVVPAFLDAGTVSGRTLPLFGTLGLAPSVGVSLEGRRFEQNTSGVAVGAAYEVGDLKMDFGSSPLGFPIETLVGGINWAPKMDRVSFKLDLARRSVTDSLLSYAGAVDPGTGVTWGGVTKNGGRMDVAYDMGQYGVYANGGYAVLDGERVARNSVYEVGAGFYARALDRRDMRVTYGVNFTALFYEKNLRRFTFGHGGYFSPQTYFAVTVPVEWEGGRDRFSYKLNAGLGIQSFREDGTAAFPNDPDLQLAVEQYLEDAALDEIATTTVGGYPAKSSTGIGFNFGGRFEYLIAPQVVAGARFGVDNARDYEEAYALGYLRFSFSGQRAVSVPPSLLYPYYDFGDPTP